AAPEATGSRAAPRTELELELTRLWAELLGLQWVGPRDNFFELGGDSLLATRLLTHIEERYGLLPPGTELLQRPTVERLAEFLTGRTEAGGADGGARRSENSRPSLFCLTHAFTLSKYLPSDQLVYLLPLDETDLRRQDGIEGLAAALAEKVQAL